MVQVVFLYPLSLAPTEFYMTAYGISIVGYWKKLPPSSIYIHLKDRVEEEN